MTEEEWLVCDDSGEMLEFIGNMVTERKVRLFAVACCRRIDRLLPHKGQRIALDVAEQFADGIVSLAPLAEACGQAKAYAGLASCAVAAACTPIVPLCPKCAAPMSLRHGQRGLLFHECSSAPKCPEACPSLQGIVGYATGVAAEAAVCEHTMGYEMACNAEVSEQSQLMRDIIGNPFLCRLHQPHLAHSDRAGARTSYVRQSHSPVWHSGQHSARHPCRCPGRRWLRQCRHFEPLPLAGAACTGLLGGRFALGEGVGT